MTLRAVQSDIAYTGKIFNIRIDRLLTPDGNVRQVDVVEHNGAAAFLPLDEENRVWFVRQYRHPTGSLLLEIPAGTLEPGEDPTTCVVRECREEIGMHPAQVTPLGNCFLAPGYSTERIWLFLVEKLSPAPLPPDEDEDITIEKIPLDSISELIRNGTLVDAKSIVAYHLLTAARS